MESFGSVKVEVKTEVKSEDKKRRPNFSAKECDALVEAVGHHYDAIFGKFSSNLTNDRKKELWNDVVNKVNAVSSVEPPRNAEEVKKKYQVLKSNVKKVETNNSLEMKKTGGGKANLQQQNAIGEQILALIPRVEISGISGGIDISKMSTVDPTPLGLMSICGPSRNDKAVVVGGLKPKESQSAAPTTEMEDEDFSGKSRKRPPQTTLFALQAKQVKLLETQTLQLTRIGNLLEQRNRIENEKLQIMKNN